jgi:spermidine/putrescine transport system ATP-binding protein
MAPLLGVRDVTKQFTGASALDRVSIEVGHGEFIALLGPSGCGKTTLLRCIAGFVTPDAGRIEIDGADITALPPHKRPLNTVFQSYALFPHMNVADNVGYGPARRGMARTEIAKAVRNALELVGLDGLEARRPRELSGGQQQRVALARAIVNQPRLLLLDEPLAALDLKLRKQMQLELKRLQHKLGITFVFVTHDQEEAMTMADRIVVMNAGRVEQVGTAQEIYRRPRSRFVAEFIGEANLLELMPVGSHALRARIGGPELPCPDTSAGQCTGVLRAEDVLLHEAAEQDAVPATVTEVIDIGGQLLVYLDVGGKPLLMRRLGGERSRFEVGRPVFVGWSGEKVHILDEGPASS